MAGINPNSLNKKDYDVFAGGECCVDSGCLGLAFEPQLKEYGTNTNAGGCVVDVKNNIICTHYSGNLPFVGEGGLILDIDDPNKLYSVFSAGPTNACFGDAAWKIPAGPSSEREPKFRGTRGVAPMGGLTVLGENCFRNCGYGALPLKINFAETKLTDIGRNCFYKGNANWDREVVLPETLEYLGEYAFSRNYLYDHISVPANVTTNDKYNFHKKEYIDNLPCSLSTGQEFFNEATPEDEYYRDKATGGFAYEFDSCLNIRNMENIGTGIYSGNTYSGCIQVCAQPSTDYGIGAYQDGCYYQQEAPFSGDFTGISGLPINGFYSYNFNEIQSFSNSIINLTIFVPSFDDPLVSSQSWDDIWQGNEFAVRTYDYYSPSKIYDTFNSGTTCTSFTEHGVYNFGEVVEIEDLKFVLGKGNCVTGDGGGNSDDETVESLLGGWRRKSFKFNGAETLDLEDGIIYIPQEAFAQTSIRESKNWVPLAESGSFDEAGLYIPASVKLIEKSAFKSCRNIKHVTFAGTPKWIQAFAFAGAATLQTVEFGAPSDNCDMYIDDTAFGGNFPLKKVRFPRNLGEVGEDAFNPYARSPIDATESTDLE